MNWKKMIENKQDRLLAFFDAILAIAITVLALEITVPSLGTVSAGERHEFFIMLTCYLISFVAMATLWYLHTSFFANHSLTGTPGEFVKHLLLLFLITLFQPVTRAIGEYPDDGMVMAVYIGVFVFMYGTMLVIFYTTNRNESLVEGRREETKKRIKETSESLDRERDEWDRILSIAYAVNNPEDVLETAMEHLPDEYHELVEEIEETREKSMKVAALSTCVMAAAVILAVIGLAFSMAISYVCLAAGLVSLMVIRIYVNKKQAK